MEITMALLTERRADANLFFRHCCVLEMSLNPMKSAESATCRYTMQYANDAHKRDPVVHEGSADNTREK